MFWRWWEAKINCKVEIRFECKAFAKRRVKIIWSIEIIYKIKVIRLKCNAFAKRRVKTVEGKKKNYKVKVGKRESKAFDWRRVKEVGRWESKAFNLRRGGKKRIYKIAEGK
jgi:hypothetical protein